MICKGMERYCCEDISKIENYEEAVADTTQMWHCHHRLELVKTGAVVDSTKGKSSSLKGKHWKLVDGKRVWY